MNEHTHHTEASSPDEAVASDAETRDPVCGMKVRADSPHRVTYDGHEVGFCSAGCREKFRAEPAKFSGKAKVEPSASTPPVAPGAVYTCPMHPDIREDRPGTCPKCGMALELASPPAATRAEWTCPMHPEIVRDAPGSCPICGMALEPRTAAADAEDSAELVDMRRRFWFAAVLTLPLVFLSMGDMLPGHPVSSLMSMRVRVWLELALAAPVVLWSAWPFYVRFVQSLKNRSLNMFTLIGLGVSVAYVYSLIAALLPGMFPPSFREEGEVAVYFEAAAVIFSLILLGQVLELRARSQTGAAIKKLLGIAATSARRLLDDGTSTRTVKTCRKLATGSGH